MDNTTTITTTNAHKRGKKDLSSKLSFGFLEKGSIKKKIFTSFGIIAGTLVVMGVISFFSIYSMKNKFDYVAQHDAPVIENARQLSKLVVDMETGQRGFIITGEDEFLEPYTNGEKEFSALVEEEIVLISDNPRQVERLRRIESTLQSWKEKAAAPEIELAKNVHGSKLNEDGVLFTVNDLSEALQKGTGKKLLDKLRSQFQEFIDEELALTAERYDRASSTSFFALMTNLLLIVIGVLAALVMGNALSKKIGPPITVLQTSAESIAKGDLKASIQIDSNDELGDLASAMITMRDNIGDGLKKTEEQTWLLEGGRLLTEEIKGEQELFELTKSIINSLTPYIGGQMGAFYLKNEKDELVLMSTYAYDKRNQSNNVVKIGEGIVGQVARENKSIIFSDIPEDYFNIGSGLGKMKPVNIIAFPVVFQDEVRGVIEIGSLHEFSDLHLNLVKTASESIGIAINSSESRDKVNTLLMNSQQMTEELQANEEELRAQQERLEQVQLEMNQQIDTMNEAAIVSETDANGNITFVNDRFCEISGYSREELIGQNHRIIKSGKQPEGLFVGMWKAITMGRVWQGQVLNKKKGDLGYYWVETTIMPFKDIHGKIVKYVGIRFDITEQMEQKKALEIQTTELEEVAQQLEENNQNIHEKNEALSQAEEAIRLKAEALQTSSRYKSEFLANMSHELRTPLNSVLVLTQLLKDNQEGNLTEEQLEYVGIIKKSGGDLLKLINEVLDLAKVESGKLDFNVEAVKIKEFSKDIKDMFHSISLDKKVEFEVNLDPELPEQLETDEDRLKQVVKNMLSNAFKFTDSEGKVTFDINLIEPKMSFEKEGLINSKQVIEMAVTDTGIGIPEDKISAVFEAFQQVDGSTARKYGGTGLGLSISRELIGLLGGEIHLTSEVGKGSRFAVYLPLKSESIETVQVEENEVETSNAELSELFGGDNATYRMVIPDDRDGLKPGDKKILIVEDDLNFAKVLLNFGRKQGYKGVVTDQGDLALKYVKTYKPDAIMLDMQLPVMDGWTVLRHLKASEYSSIPVHVLSSIDKEKLGLSLGAVNYITKPVTSEQLLSVFDHINNSEGNSKKVLIVEDNEEQSKALQTLFKRNSIECETVLTAEEATKSLENDSFQCITLDLSLSDSSGLGLFEKIKKISPDTPIVIYTGGELSINELKNIEKYQDSSVVLKTGDSLERVLQEVELFYNHIVKEKDSNVKNGKPVVFQELPNTIKGKKILLVDDDIRNIYTLKAILKGQDLIVNTASNGIEAIEAMEKDPSIDIILMDIMMPEMDGYEAMTKLREDERFKKLPIIAITAKAMKGDRQKCIDAGASDYVSKPIDIEQLLSLMRVWLYAE